MPKIIITNLKEIPSLAKKLALGLTGGETFALVGSLGAGKTTFVKLVAKNIKLKKTVTSPTFVIMNMYEVRLKKKPILFLHLDLYRTKSFKEVKTLGLTELWGQKNVITFIEWADKIKKHLPKKTTLIKFENE